MKEREEQREKQRRREKQEQEDKEQQQERTKEKLVWQKIFLLCFTLEVEKSIKCSIAIFFGTVYKYSRTNC